MKTWFITGVSRGLGLALAQAALARGDTVVGTVRAGTPDLVAGPGVLHLLTLDMADAQSLPSVVDQAFALAGMIDVIVNNAGYGLLGAVEEANADEVRAVYETNVFGLLNVTRAALPVMRRQGSGHVMNISSVGGYSSYAGWGVYGSTKFAVEGLTEALAMELAPLHIRATVVEPGFFRTDFLDTSSLVATRDRIDAYADTVGKMRDFAADANHAQPGDPLKLADALLQLADAAQPPVRLQLGSDTVARVRAKNAAVEQEMSEWLDLALSTDFSQA
jgi:NAD(P)-dependent dehydrogenase (short-subunit alcohol dehydrogenase family)